MSGARRKSGLIGYRNAVEERTRHGKTIYYFRVGKGVRWRINGIPGTKKFDTEYHKIAAGDFPQQPPHTKRGLQEVLVRIESCLSSARARAKKKGIDFDIDIDWCENELKKHGGRCAVTGMEFNTRRVGNGKRDPLSPSLDRIDPRGGYTKDNVRIIILAANIMLSDWGEDFFRRVAWNYNRHQRRITP